MISELLKSTVPDDVILGLILAEETDTSIFTPVFLNYFIERLDINCKLPYGLIRIKDKIYYISNNGNYIYLLSPSGLKIALQVKIPFYYDSES